MVTLELPWCTRDQLDRGSSHIERTSHEPYLTTNAGSLGIDPHRAIGRHFDYRPADIDLVADAEQGETARDSFVRHDEHAAARHRICHLLHRI